MKVKDLKRMLEGVDDNLDVHIVYNYGDRSNTLVAPVAREALELDVVDSAYFNRPVLVVDEDETRDGRRPAFVISETSHLEGGN